MVSDLLSGLDGVVWEGNRVRGEVPAAPVTDPDGDGSIGEVDMRVDLEILPQTDPRCPEAS